MKQTAVEWFAWKFAVTNIEEFKDNFNDIINQAKEMDKEQQQKIGIIMAIFAEELGDKKCIELLNKAEQLIHETFKSE